MYENQNFCTVSPMISVFFLSDYFFLILLNGMPDATTQFNPRNSLVNQDDTV